MNKNNNSPEKSNVMPVAQRLSNFMRIYSADPISGEMIENNHEFKATENLPKKQASKPRVNLGGAYCANCGGSVKHGMFCSISCERSIFGG